MVKSCKDWLFLRDKKHMPNTSFLASRTIHETLHRSMKLVFAAVLFMMYSLTAFRMSSLPRRASSRRLASLSHKVPTLSQVLIAKGKERIFEQGDPLVFNGAISNIIGKPVLGDEVLVKDFQGNLLGRGLYNPHSMYRVRVIASKDDKLINAPLAALIKGRIEQAVQSREAMVLPRSDTDVYRLINSEGDRLSGVIVDVIGSTVVVQSSALWAEIQKESIEAGLCNVPQFKDKTILWRRALSRLNQDGLQELGATDATIPANFNADSDASATDNVAESEVVTENGIKYKLCAATDQKTGFYCDQRENRQLIRSLSPGKTVLDAYCYTGGFTLNAVQGGAARVTSIDSSARAIESLSENLALNNMTSFVAPASTNNHQSNLNEELSTAKATDGQVELIKGEAERTMQEMIKAKKSFDVVICDPPKLAPKRADLERAMRKYKQINTLAMQLVNPKGGLLLTCTCSAAMTQSGKFESVVQSAAKAAGRDVTIVSKSGAALDHPTVVACPESNYLTALLLYVY